MSTLKNLYRKFEQLPDVPKILVGIAVIVLPLGLIFSIFAPKKPIEPAPKSVAEIQPIKQIDTTSPDYIISNLSTKPTLTKEEKRKLELAKDQKEYDSIMAVHKEHVTGLKAKEEAFKDEYVSGWDGTCRPVVEYLKKRLNDPGSFDHEETYLKYDEGGDYFFIMMKYRAKNSFGALVLSGLQCKVSPQGVVYDMVQLN